VLLTIFVNPLQFGPAEDFETYPRTFDSDLTVAAASGADVVFAPSPDVVYPTSPRVRVDPGELGLELEGAVREGHFAGVLTVVAKLLHLTGPDAAMFGEKDYQQLVLVRQMVADLDVPAEIVPVPTVREADGLALSSRNRYLKPPQRRAALGLSRALFAGASAGGNGPAAVLEAAGKVLADEALVEVDYLELRSPDLAPAPEKGPARLLVAARVGKTRLIDNVAVEL
jgi:pantoate--beta-alanine ligase